MKKNIRWAIFAVATIAVVVLARWFTWNRVRPAIAWASDRFTGMRIDVRGDLTVAPSGRLVIEAEDVRITDKRDGRKRQPFLEMDRLTATWRLPALRDRRIELEETTLGPVRLDVDQFAESKGEKPSKEDPEEDTAWRLTWKRVDIPSFTLVKSGRVVGEWSGWVRGELATAPLAISGHVALRGKDLQTTMAAFDYRMTDQIARYQLAGDVHFEPGRLAVENFDAEIAGSSAVGKFAIAFSPVSVDTFLHFKDLRFKDLGAFLPKRVQEELPATRLDSSSSSLYSKAPISKEWMNGPRLDVQAKVDRFVGDGKASLIKSFDLNVKVQDGKADVAVPRSEVMGGEIRVDLALGSAPGGITARLSGTAHGLAAGRVFQEFLTSDALKKRRFGKLKADELIEGEMDLFLDVTGKGASMSAIMGTLAGHAGVYVGEGRVSSLAMEALGLDLTESIGVLLARRQTVEMQCVVVGADAKAGVLSFDPAYVSTSDSDLVAKGEIDLAVEDARIELRTYPKDPSIGVLRTPIKLTGQLVDPRLRLETKDLAGRVAIGIALGLLSPAASLLATIEPGNAPNRSCSEHRKKLLALRNAH